MPPRPRSEGKFYTGQVVNAVLQLMEQGPKPMRNMKPSKKNPNGADQFQSDHQREYESYEAQASKERAEQVNYHNAACPKMRDELDRRRSTARATAPAIIVAKRSRGANNMYFDPNCRACQKMRKAAESKKRQSKTRPRRSEKKRKPFRSRVNKPKKGQRKAKTSFGLAKIRTNKGCQYYSQYTNKGTIANLSSVNQKSEMSDEAMTSEVLYFSNREQRNSQAVLTNPSLSQNGSKSDMISQHPDTSVNSLSSYNSNMSLDHEPMVSQ